MFINGVQFNTDVGEILNTLKGELSANGISRFAKMFDSGEDYMVCCPYHKNGQERRPSAGIRKSDGMFHCLACGETHGLDELIANCFGHSDPMWGYRWLVQNFAVVQVEERKPLEFNLDRTQTQQTAEQLDTEITEEELDTYRYVHPYMYKRGLTDDIIDKFDIGYDKKTDSITFPVRYGGGLNFGKCMFIARRQIKTKRFDLPKSIDKPLYGTYEIWECCEENLVLGGRGRRYPVDKVYVCEGLFDCLRLWCNGKFAVAGFGCLFSRYQIEQLKDLPTRQLVLALDNDKAGREATEKLKKTVTTKLITEVILPEGRKDIGECTDEEIMNLQEVW